MISKYVYIIRVFDGNDIVYSSKYKLPVTDLMLLMMKHNADMCELYQSNYIEDKKQWKLLSMFGGIESTF